MILASTALSDDQVSIPTTAEAFYQPGTQPLPDRPGTDPIQPMDEFRNASFSCQQCHLFDDDDNPDIDTGPMNLWAASMMGQSARDPVWQAALAISITFFLILSVLPACRSHSVAGGQSVATRRRLCGPDIFHEKREHRLSNAQRPSGQN